MVEETLKTAKYMACHLNDLIDHNLSSFTHFEWHDSVLLCPQTDKEMFLQTEVSESDNIETRTSIVFKIERCQKSIDERCYDDAAIDEFILDTTIEGWYIQNTQNFVEQSYWLP